MAWVAARFGRDPGRLDGTAEDHSDGGRLHHRHRQRGRRSRRQHHDRRHRPWTVTFSSITLAVAQTLVITYGDTTGGANLGATATAPATLSTVTWTGAEIRRSRGARHARRVARDHGQRRRRHRHQHRDPADHARGHRDDRDLTYTAATGGMTNGVVTIDVPAGWTAPQLAAGAGQVTTNTGTISVAGQTITVSALTRTVGQTVTIRTWQASRRPRPAPPTGRRRSARRPRAARSRTSPRSRRSRSTTPPTAPARTR